VLPIGGRPTDRIGGGRVVVAGTSLLALATLPWLFVTDHTPYALLGVLVFVRGMGFGASIQPAAAAAFATLSSSSQVPRATAALNSLRQIGGSIGTALLAVVLQHEVATGPTATAFRHTFAWAFALTLLALGAAVMLVRAERAGGHETTRGTASRGSSAAPASAIE
jgi:MFS family permease